MEPERDKTTVRSREMLKNAGITAIPFYRTVEFAKDLDEISCARTGGTAADIRNAGCTGCGTGGF